MSRKPSKPELLVSASPCEHCLFGRDPLVSPERKQEIIDSALSRDSYFVCHVPELRKDTGTWKGSTRVACRVFFNRFKRESLALRLGVMFGFVRFAEVEKE